MKISIIGTGTWGTALAQVLVDNGNEVFMYGNQQSQVDDINNNHKNSFYFGDEITLSPEIKATTCLEDVIGFADIILLSIPTVAMRSVLTNINNLLNRKVIFINTAKGFDLEKKIRLSELIADTIDKEKIEGIVSLIGPSHAEEVIVRDLTCICSVSNNTEIAMKIAEIFSNNYFRVYINDDVIGSELGVAMKNAIAIGSGILEGLGYGANARAALVTRGLAEMVKFGMAFGGRPETYLGLTGVGDLMVTSYSFHSRNFTAGCQIGKDNSVDNFMKNNTKTVEGIKAIEIIYALAKEKNISLPVIDALNDVIFKNCKPSDMATRLMIRPLKKE